MSSADFLLSPEVQKLLQIFFAEPRTKFSIDALARRSRLGVTDARHALDHLTRSGMLCRHETDVGEAAAFVVNTSFVFYAEFRRIALKSFAAAEPIGKMLRAKFKTSILQAFVLGEDDSGTVELLVVHGELVPDRSDMAEACRRLSASLGRQLTVHVISRSKYVSLTPRDAMGAKLAAPCAFEIIGAGGTKAAAPKPRLGLLQSARTRWAALTS